MRLALRLLRLACVLPCVLRCIFSCVCIALRIASALALHLVPHVVSRHFPCLALRLAFGRASRLVLRVALRVAFQLSLGVVRTCLRVRVLACFFLRLCSYWPTWLRASGSARTLLCVCAPLRRAAYDARQARGGYKLGACTFGDAAMLCYVW